jgi:hypothetical protein
MIFQHRFMSNNHGGNSIKFYDTSYLANNFSVIIKFKILNYGN